MTKIIGGKTTVPIRSIIIIIWIQITIYEFGLAKIMMKNSVELQLETHLCQGVEGDNIILGKG